MCTVTVIIHGIRILVYKIVTVGQNITGQIGMQIIHTGVNHADNYRTVAGFNIPSLRRIDVGIR